ncbi:hypothetical protein LT330_007724 [Penicillium expansum]|uniref:Tetratricopeptide-like helical n=1 Tax=Penicillium expansum TaxID=27334 RepID=A0A0A2I3A0_PENEN|nr:Tetratricopeptide-like helical [Penicillium expansum]KAK4866983.1 hypothetical protein LT330_007724 [Penicillium expansum]KGO37602.1 Tetratricopeptide-like helical [Penicillium expansum]KGO63304.1 Tetratricopeptide-like helical [Penicillium expansum]
MESEKHTSTTSLIALCIRDFHTLLKSIPDEQSESRLKVQDDMTGYLRTTGFERLQTYIERFKTTSGISLKPFKEVSECPEFELLDCCLLYLAISFFSGSEESLTFDDGPAGSEVDELDVDDSDSDGFWDQIKADSDENSKLDEYMLDIQYTISSLYKFSLTLQNPAHRDRTAQASRIELGHFEFYDIQHVSDKYNIPRDSTLAQRLGRANTKRRQLLAYHKDHTEKISRYINVVVQKATEVPMASIKDTGTQSTSTRLTQDTTVSTIHHHDYDSGSDSAQTKFSTATSTAGDQAHVLTPPPPPADAVNTMQNQPFFCPYCHQTIQLEHIDEDWEYHVYSDLRPYICTFGDCVKANQLYDSYTEWSEHERQFHRREWICNLCSCAFKTEVVFRNHLEDAHAGVLPKDQQQAMVELSERTIFSAQQCPLCTKPPISNSSHFQQHLARHLQQISLFVLPYPEPEENEQAARDEESNESQQVVVIDDEARILLKSISTNQESPGIDRGQTLSEGSKSDDQLEENKPVTEDQVDEELQEMEKNKRALGPENPSTVESMNKLVSTYWKRDQLEEAVKLLEQVLAIEDTKLGIDHPSTLTNMSNIARSYRSQGNWVEAWKLDTKTFEKKKLTLGPKHLSTLDTMDDIATSYEMLGRYEERELIARQLVDLGEEVLSPTHNSLLRWKTSLVSIYRVQGKLDLAEKLVREVIPACQASFGENHPLTLTSLANLASIYQRQRRWSDAEDLGKKVVRTSEIVYGETHPETLRFMSNICSAIRNQGRLGEAKNLGETAIRRMIKAGMDRQLHMMVAMVDLSVTYYMQGLLRDAESLTSRALRLMEETLGKDHPQTIFTMLNLSSIYKSQNKLNAAKELVETVHARRERILGKDHPSTIEALGKMRRMSGRSRVKGLHRIDSLEHQLET